MIFQLFLVLLLAVFEVSSSKSKRKIKEKYAKLPEIYSYQIPDEVAELEAITVDDSGQFKESIDEIDENSLETYLSIAVSDAEHLEWKNLPESEMPKGNSPDLIAEFTTINVPLFYGMDAEKYGITDESIKKSFFSIYLRKYHWGNLNRHAPVKHVILVAGGPGESGQSWIKKLHKLSRQYGRSNLILYVADHRGVYKSRDIFELVKREKSRTSWKRVRRSESIDEKNWQRSVIDFEKDVGYPLVAMTCSNAARDLGLISLVLRNKMLISSSDKFYLHAQSYGTQVTTRTLNLLPEFYDAVLLEGLATMELVKESAKSDFGILNACAEDRKCAQQFVKTNVPRDRLPLQSPFDLRNLLEGMAQKTHNRACRDIFLLNMRQYVYSNSVSFWDAIHLSFYELLSDDFLNPYTGTNGDFYPGMLVLPLIRDMYYCEDTERFRRQVKKFIEMIAISVRGLSEPYVKTPSKSKPVDPKQHSSYFVQNYINAHEAFDMRGMSAPTERGYCDKSNQGDLVNQCPIWRDQVRKIDSLKQLSSEQKLKASKAASSKNNKPFDTRRATLDKLDGKGRDDNDNNSLSSLSTSTSTSAGSSSSSSDADTSDSGSFYKSVIKMFGNNEKKNKTKKKKTKKNKSKKHRNRDIKGKKAFKTTEIVSDTGVKSKMPKLKSTSTKKDLFTFKRFYYDLDDLAYEVPRSSKTKIFVTVGSLDIKTPILEARRLLSRIHAPFKTLFELKNVAHSTDPCRGEIIRAFIAEGDGERFRAAMAVADECVRELAKRRKLDWELQGVNNIPRDDWIV